MSFFRGDPRGMPDILSDEDTREPPLFKVILHNDDYTTMEFVVAVLVEIFHKSAEEAALIMLSVHEKGVGVCGIYPRELAETKAALVRARARRKGFPLKCTLEAE
jgi:ATP-dependent Clp protease adaptor protein ClpS